MTDDSGRDDKTIIRRSPEIRKPRPGGGDSTSHVRSPQPILPVQVDPGTSTEEFFAPGRNSLLASAGTLLVLGVRLQESAHQADLPTLRRRAMEELQKFSSRTRDSGISAEIADVASYVLCTYFDTAVMRTPWGARGEWGKYSLLVALHGEAFGGENFFRIAERALSDPRKFIDLLELLHVCLALGYEGRYRGVPDGKLALDEFRLRLFRAIRELRGEATPELSVRWKGTDEVVLAARRIPAWVAGLAALLAVFSIWVVYRQILTRHAAPIQESLSRPIAPIVSVQAPITQSKRLKPLLEREANAGLVTIEEQGDRTVIVLNASTLFASGSADVSVEELGTIAAIARAIDEVPGRVIVVGHTDDQPLRSFRFSDNFALSRARAEAVRVVLASTLEGSSQLEISGAGSTQPRFEPADERENRARNRRVELIHFAVGAGS